MYSGQTLLNLDNRSDFSKLCKDLMVNFPNLIEDEGSDQESQKDESDEEIEELDDDEEVQQFEAVVTENEAKIEELDDEMETDVIAAPPVQNQVVIVRRKPAKNKNEDPSIADDETEQLHMRNSALDANLKSAIDGIRSGALRWF